MADNSKRFDRTQNVSKKKEPIQLSNKRSNWKDRMYHTFDGIRKNSIYMKSEKTENTEYHDFDSNTEYDYNLDLQYL